MEKIYGENFNKNQVLHQDYETSYNSRKQNEWDKLNIFHIGKSKIMKPYMSNVLYQTI